MGQEYKEIAALCCLQIDLLASIAEQGSENLKEIILTMKQDKDNWIKDPEARKERYESCGFLFHLANSKKS